jgi:hypothetical protein
MLCYPCSKELFMNKKRNRKRTAARKPARAERLAVLSAESDRQRTDLIRRRLALPIEQRTAAWQ